MIRYLRTMLAGEDDPERAARAALRICEDRAGVESLAGLRREPALDLAVVGSLPFGKGETGRE